MNGSKVLSTIVMAVLMFVPLVAEAQDKPLVRPVDDSNSSLESIEELTRHGKYFEAVVKMFEQENLPTVAEKLAAAKAAWALGLSDTARELWDEVFAQRNYRDTERSRAMLGRSIMELQETKYENARSIAEAAAQELGASDLRAQFWLVIGEGLKEQGALSLAEGYYKKAADEGNKQIAAEATYLLGECQFRLGLINEARYTFASLESNSLYTAMALRRLIEIDLTQRNYEGVLTWVEEARDGYPSDFQDGWTTYAMATALGEMGKTEDARKEVDNFGLRHDQEDPWFLLAKAAVEVRQAVELFPDLGRSLAEKKEEAALR